jgi:hydrogenase-4 component B
MDKIAAYALSFFRREPMAHAVNYFSPGNLKGAAISITIGVLVFLLVGMKWLTRKEDGHEVYRNVWPRGLDLEDAVYRPALRGLSFVGGMAARLVESVGALLIYGTVDLLFLGAKDKVVPPEDEQFSAYSKQSERSRVERSFSADLLYAACGVLALMALAAWNMLR